jgi:hypothetical protein
MPEVPEQKKPATPWEIRSNGIDESSAAMSTFVDKVPVEQFEAFMKAHPDIQGTLTYENHEMRGSITFGSLRKREPIREHRDLQWWSVKTGYKSVPYAEFVKIEGEGPGH